MDFRENVERAFGLGTTYSLDFVQSFPRVISSLPELLHVFPNVTLWTVQGCYSCFLNWSVRAYSYSAFFLNRLFQLVQLITLPLEVYVAKPPASHSVHF